jgi:thioester reductase-like protein
MENLANDLGRFAASQPDAVLYSFLDGAGRIVESYTYQRFHERTNFLAAALLADGRIATGDRVLLVYAPGLEFIVAFFACAKMGAIPVPVPPPSATGLAGGLERLSHVAADCGAAVALTSDSYLAQLEKFKGRSQDAVTWLDEGPLAAIDWVSTSALDGALADFDVRTSPLLFLQYTSGSTQSPRGVMVTHANVRHNSRATMTHRPVAVSWMPQYHVMGLIGYYLYVLLTGGCTYGFAANHFLKRPILWIETIAKYRGTITSAPNFAFEYCLRDDKLPESLLEGIDLSSMLVMMNASEPVRAMTYRRFLDRFAPYGLAPTSSVVFYGLAENTLSVTGNGRRHVTVNTALLEQNHLRLEEPRPDLVNQSLIASCGRPLFGVEVRIVDPAASVPLGEGGIGEIWIAGGSKAAGYWNNRALTGQLFEARVDDAGEAASGEFLRTGDVGFFHEEELFICGRLKDVVIVGGKNYYPADIEAVIERASPKVRFGCVAAFGVDQQDDGEGIVVLAEAHRANDLPDLDEIARAVRRHCHVELALLAVVPHGTIIKTSSGKIARQACRRAWESGAFPVITSRVPPPRAAGSSPIEQLLDRFDAEEADDRRTLADLGVDSLTLVELSLRLERLWKEAHPSHDHDQRTDDALFDLRVLQAATLGELRAFVQEFAGGGSQAIPVEARGLYLARQAEIDAQQLQQMQADARLSLDLAAPRDPAPNHPNSPVLLTGATGFLGSFLLEALLRLTDRDIIVIARGDDDAHARGRIESALHRTGLLDASLSERFASRVKARRGDLRLARLGLDEGVWRELGETLSGVYHCGAEVDYVKPYEQLRDVNVSSTRALLELVAASRGARLHYISTTFMFGFVARAICGEADCNAEMEGLNFGYSQSKWVAEQLVLDAMARDVQATIYRPSLISASRTGRYAKGDLMARVFAYMIRHGLSVDTANQVSLLPADVCANNIVALSQMAASAGRSFHLTADNYYTMQDACQAITATHGYAFEYIGLEPFIAHMNAHCTKHDLLYPLMAFFNQNFRRILSMRDKRYDNRLYREARARTTATQPEPPLDAVVGGIVEFLQTEHLVPPPVRSVRAI